MPTTFHPYRLSPVHRTLERHGATWVEVEGWRVAAAFADPMTEAEGVRRGVGLQDRTEIGKLDLKGRDLAGLWRSTTVPPGTTTLRLTPQHWLVLTPPGKEAALTRDLS